MQASTPLDPQCVHDLGLAKTLATLGANTPGRLPRREGALDLCTDPAVITYRQDVLDDLWRNPDFTRQLQGLLPDIQALDPSHTFVDRRQSSLQEVTWRLTELERFVTCIQGLHAIFTQMGDRLKAAGWQTLRTLVTQTAGNTVYQQLTRELPDMLRTMRSKVSVTIGVNLDRQLRPVAATLLSVNDQKFTAATFLDRLFGKETQPFKGLGPLHTVPDLDAGPLRAGNPQHSRDVNPLMVPLFSDLAQVLETVCRPIARALRHYNGLHSGLLATVSGDMTFYLAAITLMQRLHACGLPLCRPVIAPMRERVCELRQAYNLNLALDYIRQERLQVSEALVTNDVQMGEHGRVCILTGPNQGGKTTYTQMAGVCQVLAQLGLWVPAAQARLSPVDHIYTHYPVEEHETRGKGRFGEEAQRLSQIFAHSTRHSLILLNESLASTNPGESLYIAQDVVRILRRMGARAIFATHLHELAADVEALNANTPGDSRIVSLIASRRNEGEQDTRRSYKIVPGQPMGRSYAQEIAAHYGISYEQLTALLQQRGVLEE